jgi:hypothetical protein
MSSYGSYGVLILMMGEVSMLTMMRETVLILMMARMDEMKMDEMKMDEMKMDEMKMDEMKMDEMKMDQVIMIEVQI